MYEILRKQNKNQTSSIRNSQDAINARLPTRNTDDDMEIVVVSDTVRQRRSRTPLAPTTVTPTDSSAIQLVEKDTLVNIMPDLLPKTFHLVESSSLFSQINDPNTHFMQKDHSILMESPNIDESIFDQEFSIVEIRETNISTPKKAINTFNSSSEKMGDELNTFSILESVNYLEPSRVETVHILDATSEPSDTDTCCSTPNLDERPPSKILPDNDGDESDEYETGEPAPQLGSMMVSKAQISFNEQQQSRKIHNDRDVLKDSEQTEVNANKAPAKPQRKKFSPTLKEILNATDRNSFYNSDEETGFDDPLIFSDDDDDEDSSIVSPNDCDVQRRDTVLMKNP